MPMSSVFTREWERRAPGQRRSLPRMAALLRALGDPQDRVPVLGVVGSKGKGTAATVASARLAAAGLRVVTVTGPSYRSHRERVRVSGCSATAERMAELGAAVGAAAEGLPPVDPGSADPVAAGHLAPSGLFLAAGLLEAERIGADVAVLEAGQGGRRDDLALTRPRVVSMGAVFGEHLGVLGDSPAEIADEKAGVSGPDTRALVHLPQQPDVAAALRRAAGAATGGRVVAEEVDPAAPGVQPAPELRPPGLSAHSAVVGYAAAERMLTVLGRDPAADDPARIAAVLGSVRLPGRLSRHRVGGAELLVDCAIDRTGMQAALAYARSVWPRIDRVLVGLPDHKDVGGAIAELAGLPVTASDLPLAHLRFEHPLPPSWERIGHAGLTAAAIEARGPRVLAFGTVYFAAHLLEAVGADTDALFRVPDRAPGG
ncbi:hypothetical protein [Nocardiopsis coralliicola]